MISNTAKRLRNKISRVMTRYGAKVAVECGFIEKMRESEDFKWDFLDRIEAEIARELTRERGVDGE